MVIKYCNYCKREYKATPSHNKKYCSLECCRKGRVIPMELAHQKKEFGFKKGHTVPLWLREKLLKLNTGRKLSEETKTKISKKLKGKKRSKETRRKIALAKIGDKNPSKKPEVREKMRLAKLGKMGHWLDKIRPDLRGPKNHICLNCGKKFHVKHSRLKKSKIVCCSLRCISEWRLDHPEQSSHWRGGGSFYRGVDFRKIRLKIIKKHNCCQVCGKTNCKLDVHHIVPYRYSKDNSVENLILLCKPCHMEMEWGGGKIGNYNMWNPNI